MPITPKPLPIEVEIQDPIYNLPITIYIGTPDQYRNHLISHWPDAPGINTDYPAQGGEHRLVSYRHHDIAVLAASLIWLPHWNCTTQEYGTLAHEVSHHAFAVMRLCHIPVEPGHSEEAYCYYFDMMYTAALAALSSDWKRRRRKRTASKATSTKE